VEEAEMAYERLEEALRQLKTDRERAEATKQQQRKAATESRTQFARLKSVVIGPVFNEVAVRLEAEGFFAESVDDQNDPASPISLNVNLSEDEGLTLQGSIQVRFDPDKNTCEFGRSTMAETSPTRQIVFNDGHHQLEEINEQLIREAAEQFVLDLIAGNNFH
jgi:hypothetical protein